VFFGTSVDDQAYLDYTIVAKQFERITFYHTFAPEAREQFSFDADVKVVLFKSFDEKRNIYSENVEVVALSHFLTVNSVPTVMPFNDKAIQAIFQAGHPALFLFANENEESTLAFEEFSQVASQFKDK
jgi:protein disulfide-isomerase A1